MNCNTFVVKYDPIHYVCCVKWNHCVMQFVLYSKYLLCYSYCVSTQDSVNKGLVVLFGWCVIDIVCVYIYRVGQK